MGAGDGAVYTVTLLPPPCGTSAMERILTPIVAQSSLEASLTSIGTVALCGAELGGVFIEAPEPPPPHAASSAPATAIANNRDLFEDMTGISSDLTITNSCQMPAVITAPLLQASTALGRSR